MSILDMDACKEVLAVVRQQSVQNIEQVARSAGLARVTAKKYLDALVAEGLIQETHCGNSRVYLSVDSRGSGNLKSPEKESGILSKNLNGDA